MSGRTYANNSSNRSLGRVGMSHGSAVASRSSGSSSGAMASSSSRGSSTGASPRTYVDNSQNRSLGRVGMDHGTAVNSKSSGNSTSTGSTGPKTYVDNYQNRQLGRVGQEYGPGGASSTTSESSAYSSSKPVASITSEGPVTYRDNAYNRRLDRVGKPIGTHVVHQDGSVSIGKATYVLSKTRKRKQKIADAIENNSESFLEKFHSLDIEYDDSSFDMEEDHAKFAAAKIVRLECIEEDWKKHEINPLTDLSKIEAVRISKQDLEQIQLISRGEFGVVYAALWKTTKTPVAYKRLACQSLTQKKIQSFESEINIFSKLEHRNIVKMFGAVLEKNDIGIVMEYFKKTLFDSLFYYEEDCFTPSDKLRIIEEVGSALEYLHTHQPPIAHCDIKSQNILLDGNGTAKVCDFGLSIIKNTVQSSCSRKGDGDAPPGQGTPRYSAPEVLRGEILKLEGLMMTDIYSLSLVAYEVVLEEEPYDDLNTQQLTRNVGYGALRPSLEKLENAELASFLSRCWSKIPQERPTIQLFNQEWKKIKLS